MVRGRHVLILSASITTGYSIKAAVEAVQYYGGQVAGLAAIFATTHEFMGMRVNSFSIQQPPRLPELRIARLPHVQSRPAHRRAGEQLRLFLFVIPISRTAACFPLSAAAVFLRLRTRKGPRSPGAMYNVRERVL